MPMPIADADGNDQAEATTGSNDTVQVASDPGSFGWDARRGEPWAARLSRGSKTLRTRDSCSCAPIATRVQIAHVQRIHRVRSLSRTSTLRKAFLGR
jgi:uncharacterized membrane protein